MTTRADQYAKIQKSANYYLRTSYENFASERSLLTFACKHCNAKYHTSSLQYQEGEHYCSPAHQSLYTDSTQKFKNVVAKFQEVHGQYYTYTPLNSDEVNVICPKHGGFVQKISDHLMGDGCEQCLMHTFSDKNDVTEFINAAHQVHDFKYRYEHVTSPLPSNVVVDCPKHGHFLIDGIKHLNGQGCEICTTSHQQIRTLTQTLKQCNLQYAVDKSFVGCVSDENRLLSFDLYIPKKHLCVEFDNKHHFEPVRYYDTTTPELADHYFEVQNRNDQIKSDYCKNNGINLIRISYNNYTISTVMSYIQGLEDQRHLYTWDCFVSDIHNITSYIKTFGYVKFAVYGISRGGLPFSVHVSNHFEDVCQHGIINFQRYDGKDKVAQLVMQHDDPDVPIFVIDDLISSGITMNNVVSTLRETFPKVNIHPIVIFGAHNEFDIFYIRQHPKRWIIFPYEI